MPKSPGRAATACGRSRWAGASFLGSTAVFGEFVEEFGEETSGRCAGARERGIGTAKTLAGEDLRAEPESICDPVDHGNRKSDPIVLVLAEQTLVQAG
jgi:hypothetical protein